MNAGITLRIKPKVHVISGYSPEAPSDRRQTAKVHASHTDIKSGMLISIASASGTWVKGFVAASAHSPCVAENDATDPDVVASGLLAGLSCSGQFSLLTAYFKDEVLAAGDIIVPDTDTPGQFKKTSASGQVILARVGEKNIVDLGGGAYATDPLQVARAASTGVSVSAFAGSPLGNQENSEAASTASEMVHLMTNYAGVLTV